MDTKSCFPSHDALNFALFITEMYFSSLIAVCSQNIRFDHLKKYQINGLEVNFIIGSGYLKKRIFFTIVDVCE